MHAEKSKKRNSPDDGDGDGLIDVAVLLVWGVSVLGYDESEVWVMTPRKLLRLVSAYKKLHSFDVASEDDSKNTGSKIMPIGILK